jgi:hypothetical protein
MHRGVAVEHIQGTCSEVLYRQVLVPYLKRPRVKSWELRRCGGAVQIQRLEGSRPAGLWDLYLDEPVLIGWDFAVGGTCAAWLYDFLKPTSLDS